ncbi:MAG: Hsp70 family protein, partial [Chloroflexota bacterium]
MAVLISGIDFGTANTVIVGWDENQQQAQPLAVPEYSAMVQQGDEQIPIIPSLIHYASANMCWIGNQVKQRGLYHSRHTLRWMKQYIKNRSPIQIEMEGKTITPAQAGKDFLSTILTFMQEQNPAAQLKVGFSVPVDAFEHYQNWLAGFSEQLNFRDFMLVDEPVAAAIGYGATSQPGSVVFIFDFGGGTLHTSMVKIESDPGSSNQRLCRVLGKAGKNLGGMRIDQWLYQHFLQRAGLNENLIAI